MSAIVVLALWIAGALALAMRRAPLWLWALAFAVGAVIARAGAATEGGNFLSLLMALGAVASVLFGLAAIPSLRRQYVIAPAFAMVKRILPPVSETERQALEAGTVGFDAELFSGRPDWNKLRAIPPIILTPDEQAFLDGPTEELCARIDDWEIRHAGREIPKALWDFIKANGFLGMLISKEHGGLGFSAQAQSLILGKIASRSPDVVTVVMVPNSLGPGELIEKYGTPEQKSYYLPRLARGDEVPCFSLTGPTSGSDAATMRDIGTVEKGMFKGREVVGIRLDWDKRYITLGPDASLVGLAFRLFDPANLLGKGVSPGITLALIPANHPGVSIGRRHLPCGNAFPNGPNFGHDVFIPIDWVIGGAAMAGQGWRMLMECLAAGRAISLPSSAAAGAKAMLRVTTAYSRIRRQFGIAVGRMEGIEEPLARMVEAAYVGEAGRAMTAALVSRGERPSVISALMKYQLTARMRNVVNDAMDIHGGRAICDGPSNYLQSAYQMVPVGITVEGANILTRTLITFAQGALRSHPYLYREIQAAEDTDKKRGLDSFEQAFTGHIAFSASNAAGALFHNMTGGHFASAPDKAYRLAPMYRQLARASRNFALVADACVAVLGGGLKSKQKITGRMADALSELYLLAATLKRYEDDGRPAEDYAIVAFAAQNGLKRFEDAIAGTIDNFPNGPVRVALRGLVFPLGRAYKPASDRLGTEIARLATEPGVVRDRLTRHIYVSKDANDPTGLLEVAFAKVVAAEAAEKKLEKAVRAGTIQRFHGRDWIGEAVTKGVVTGAEADQLREIETLTERVIAVDHFAPAELKPHYAVAEPAPLGHNSRGLPASAVAVAS